MNGLSVSVHTIDSWQQKKTKYKLLWHTTIQIIEIYVTRSLPLHFLDFIFHPMRDKEGDDIPPSLKTLTTRCVYVFIVCTYNPDLVNVDLCAQYGKKEFAHIESELSKDIIKWEPCFIFLTFCDSLKHREDKYQFHTPSDLQHEKRQYSLPKSGWLNAKKLFKTSGSEGVHKW